MNEINNTEIISKLGQLDNISGLGITNDDTVTIDYAKSTLLYQLLSSSIKDAVINLISNMKGEHVGKYADELLSIYTDTILATIESDYYNKYSLNIGDIVIHKMDSIPNNVTKLVNYYTIDDKLRGILEKYDTIIIEEKDIIVEDVETKEKEQIKAFKKSIVEENVNGENSKLLIFMNTIADLAKINKNTYESEGKAFKLAFTDEKIQAEYGKALSKYDFVENELLWIENEIGYYKTAIRNIELSISKFAIEIQEWLHINTDALENKSFCEQWIEIFKAPSINRSDSTSQVTVGECFAMYGTQFPSSFHKTYLIIYNTTKMVRIYNKKPLDY